MCSFAIRHAPDAKDEPQEQGDCAPEPGLHIETPPCQIADQGDASTRQSSPRASHQWQQSMLLGPAIQHAEPSALHRAPHLHSHRAAAWDFARECVLFNMARVFPSVSPPSIPAREDLRAVLTIVYGFYEVFERGDGTQHVTFFNGNKEKRPVHAFGKSPTTYSMTKIERVLWYPSSAVSITRTMKLPDFTWTW